MNSKIAVKIPKSRTVLIWFVIDIGKS
jgi:hypothetical protein